MILIRFDDLCRGRLAIFGARLIYLRDLLPTLPLIATLLCPLGKLVMRYVARRERSVLIENTLQYIGASLPEALTHADAYIARRSTKFIYDELIAKAYFRKFSITDGDIELPGDSGAVVCMLHTIDAYLLATVIGKVVANGDRQAALLRTPLSGEESRHFEALALHTGAKGHYFNPRVSAEVKAAIRELKSGIRLLTFADMPAEFGRSPAVRLFGRTAWMALGGLDIARLARVPVYLGYFTRDSATDSAATRLKLHIRNFGHVHQGTSQVITEAIEKIIADDPSMWDPLISLRSYFYQPTTAEH